MTKKDLTAALTAAQNTIESLRAELAAGNTDCEIGALTWSDLRRSIKGHVPESATHADLVAEAAEICARYEALPPPSTACDFDGLTADQVTEALELYREIDPTDADAVVTGLWRARLVPLDTSFGEAIAYLARALPAARL